MQSVLHAQLGGACLGMGSLLMHHFKTEGPSAILAMSPVLYAAVAARPSVVMQSPSCQNPLFVLCPHPPVDSVHQWIAHGMAGLYVLHP